MAGPPLHFRLAGRFETDAAVALHAHPFHELILAYQGCCWINVSGREVVVEAGDLLVVPEHEPHDQRADDVVGTLYVGAHWPEDLLCSRMRIINMRGDAFIHQWMSDLVRLYKSEHPPQQAVARGLLLATLARVRQKEDGAGTAPSHPQLRTAVHFIESHLAEDLTVSQVAAQAGCSASYLTVLFRREIGCGPMAYQIRCRLNLACKHLLEPYLSIKQIAAVCGWQDPNLFVRIFRQNYRCPPGKWRKQHLLIPGRGRERPSPPDPPVEIAP